MKYFLPFLILLMITACSSNQSSFDSLDAFKAHINDTSNGFIQTKETEDFIFTVKITPPLASDSNAIVMAQLRVERKDGKPVLESGGLTKNEALEREGYMSFELAQDVFLEFDGKTQNCSFHHYERTYGLKPSVDVLFQFPAFEPKGNVSFNLRDQQFGEGLIKIEFDKNVFNKCYVK